jgi:hypothetical protein
MMEMIAGILQTPLVAMGESMENKDWAYFHKMIPSFSIMGISHEE